MIRLIAKHDKLLNDNELLILIEKAKKYLLKWIVIR